MLSLLKQKKHRETEGKSDEAGSQLKIDFYRLRSRCEDIAKTTAGNKLGMSERDKTVLPQYLRLLSSKLELLHLHGEPLLQTHREHQQEIEFWKDLFQIGSDLNAEAPASHPHGHSMTEQTHVLKTFARHRAINRQNADILEQLLEGASEQSRGAQSDDDDNGDSTLGGEREEGNEIQQKTEQLPQYSVRSRLMRRGEDHEDRNHSRRRAQQRERGSDDEGAAEDQRVQDILEGELLELTANLKDNVEQINRSLKSDALVLEATDEALDKNLSATGAENKRLTAHLSAASRGTIMTWCSLMLVGLVFICMYLFIRFFPVPRVHSEL
jgi:hypothetical protein